MATAKPFKIRHGLVLDSTEILDSSANATVTTLHATGSGNSILVDDTLRIAETGSGLRMTNVGAFDNDGSTNFRVFATNDLILAANGDSGTAITIDATNQDVTIANNIIMPTDGTIGSASDTNFIKFDETSSSYSGTDLSIGSNQSVHVLLDMNADGGTTGGFTIRSGASSIDSSTELFKVNTSGMGILGTVTINNAFTLPTADGTSGQVMTTNGSGTATWTTVSTGGGSSATGTTEGVVYGYTNSSTTNTAIGYQTLDDVTTGANNIAMGFNAQHSTTTRSNCVAIGHQAMQLGTTGNNQVGIGTNALRSSTGAGNVGIGTSALLSTTSGVDNVGLGTFALAYNTTGYSNMAIGKNCLYNNTTAVQNCAIGTGAIGNYDPGSNNVAIGTNALANLEASGANTADQNVAIGTSAGNSITTGRNNICLGMASQPSSATANGEIVLGSTAQNRLIIPAVGLDTNDASNGQTLQWNSSTGEFDWVSLAAPVVQTSDSAPSSPVDGNLWWSSNEGRLKIYYDDGTSSQWVDATPVPDTGNLSDYRVKTDIRPIENATEKVLALKPVTGRFTNSEQTQDMFLAHEVQEAGVEYAVTGEKDGAALQTMDYGKLTPVLVGALQDALARIEQLEQEIKTLKG